MSVLVLSSASPDRHVPGGIGGLCGELARLGSDVRLVVATTVGVDRAPAGVEVLVAGEAPPVIPPDPRNGVERALASATRLYATAVRSLRSRPAHVVIADGWEVTYAACSLRASHDLPILARIDAPAPGTGPVPDHRADLVAQIAWWLTYEAREVVVPTTLHRDWLVGGFRVPTGKVTVVPPGVDVALHTAARPADPRAVLIASCEPQVSSVVRSLRRRGIRVTLANPGVAQVGEVAIVAVHDPSRTDVVLAGMAAGCAVVVPASGPLRGLVHAGRGALPVHDGNELVATVAGLVDDEQRLQRLQRSAARQAARRHAWALLAPRYTDLLVRAVAGEADLRAEAQRPSLRPVLLRSGLVDQLG